MVNKILDLRRASVAILLNTSVVRLIQFMWRSAGLFFVSLLCPCFSCAATL